MISAITFLHYAKAAEARFWPKVDKSGGPDACWPWTAADDGKGRYGKFKLLPHEKAAAHRVAYALTYGVIPDGLDVLHHCDNPPCCNPAHLFTGDHNANMADMAAKGRANGGSEAGESNHNAKLTAADVFVIKGRIGIGEGNVRIARDYPVSDDAISSIRRGKTWATSSL